MNKKILFVTTHFAPDFQYGGIVESGTKLFHELKKINSNITLVCVSANPKNVEQHLNKTDFCGQSRLNHNWGISFNLIPKLWRNVAQHELFYLNGVVTFPVTLAALFCILQNKPFIVAPRGSYQPWAINHKAFKKYFYFRFFSIPLSKMAKYTHATSEAEKRELTKLGFRNIFYVPNGIHIDVPVFDKKTQKKELHLGNKFVFLFLARISKIKGLENLVPAFQKFNEKIAKKDALLLLVGPDYENHLSTLNIEKDENIKYLGEKYSDEKYKLFYASDTFVLPSYTESFGNSIAEAMACKCPIITTTGTPWKEIETYNFGKYVKPTENELFNAMTEIYFKTPKQLEEMGTRAREFILKFDWPIQAQKIYNNILKL